MAAAEYLASRDSLTGLYNRRAFEELALKVRADDAAVPLSMILIDLDHFKAINDSYGHGLRHAGLVKAAEIIAHHVGPHDVVGRGDGAVAHWDGVEFIVLLRHCPVDQAVRIAHEFRNGLAAMRAIDWPEDLVTTSSLGVASLGCGSCTSRLYRLCGRGDVSRQASRTEPRQRLRPDTHRAPCCHSHRAVSAALYSLERAQA